MMEQFKDTLSCMFTGYFYFEFTTKGIDKVLDSVLIHRGYKREDMIVFGDGHNDSYMIKYAGVGVAMDDEVILSNDEDSMAVYLNKHMTETLYV